MREWSVNPKAYQKIDRSVTSERTEKMPAALAEVHIKLETPAHLKQGFWPADLCIPTASEAKG